GAESALERGSELGGTLDVLAVSTEGLDEPVVAGRRQPGRHLALGTVETDLRDADLSPGRIVSDQDRHGELESRQCLELEAVQAERPVASDDDDLLRRVRDLHAERIGRTDAEAPERSGIEPVPGSMHT